MPVKMNATTTIKARLGIEPNGRVHKFFTNSCYKHMDKYVPKDTGLLRTIVDLNSDSIIYESTYAKPQYYGIVNGGVVRNYTTPGTGPYWDKRMKSSEMTDILSEVQKYIGGGK